MAESAMHSVGLPHCLGTAHITKRSERCTNLSSHSPPRIEASISMNAVCPAGVSHPPGLPQCLPDARMHLSAVYLRMYQDQQGCLHLSDCMTEAPIKSVPVSVTQWHKARRLSSRQQQQPKNHLDCWSAAATECTVALAPLDLMPTVRSGSVAPASSAKRLRSSLTGISDLC